MNDQTSDTTTSAQNRGNFEERSTPGRHVIFLIHGIRTQGEWTDRVENVFRNASNRPLIRKIKYGYLDVFRFLTPGSFLKQRPYDRVLDAILTEKDRNPNSYISVIAHSFGAYLIGQLLKKKPYIKIHRLLLCGSVLPENFGWASDVSADQLNSVNVDNLGESRDWSAVNDCGVHDFWPVVAKLVSMQYGASGRFGFDDTLIYNRYFSKKHSDFFTESHIREYWLPYVNDGRIVKSNEARKTTKLAVSILNLFRIPVLLLIVGVVFGGIGILSHFNVKIIDVSTALRNLPSYVEEEVGSLVGIDGDVIVGIDNNHASGFKVFVRNNSTETVVVQSGAKLILTRSDGSVVQESLQIVTRHDGSNIKQGSDKSFPVANFGGWGNSALNRLQNSEQIVNCKLEYGIRYASGVPQPDTVEFECPK